MRVLSESEMRWVGAGYYDSNGYWQNDGGDWDSLDPVIRDYFNDMAPGLGHDYNNAGEMVDENGDIVVIIRANSGGDGEAYYNFSGGAGDWYSIPDDWFYSEDSYTAVYIPDASAGAEVVLADYNPSGDAVATSDKTTSHTVTAEEARANSLAAGAAMLTAGASSDPLSPFATETTTVEKAYNWMVTHPGWMNQPQEYWPTLEDFSPGGILSESYGIGSPYSIDHSPND